MSGLDPDDIRTAAETSGLKNFSGEFTPMPGGEMNDIYLLHCGSESAVLRVARYSFLPTLEQEARALRLLDLPQVPRLLFFDDQAVLQGRRWLLESFVVGDPAPRLTLANFESLGGTLARVHQVTSPAAGRSTSGAGSCTNAGCSATSPRSSTTRTSICDGWWGPAVTTATRTRSSSSS